MGTKLQCRSEGAIEYAFLDFRDAGAKLVQLIPVLMVSADPVKRYYAAGQEISLDINLLEAVKSWSVIDEIAALDDQSLEILAGREAVRGLLAQPGTAS